MDILDLNTLDSNNEISNTIKERVKLVGVKALIETLSSDFVYHEEATRKIYAALATGNNAILFGPGGFGKSVLVKAICKELGLPIVFKVGYKGMTPEEILGVPNMNKLLEESKYETAFENGVFSKKGILILEEFMDADPSTAAALKDVLTEKGFREGNDFKESLISSVIICGNKTPDDVSLDDSTAAFYKERFPYRHKMVWKTFQEDDYIRFFKAYFDSEIYSNKIKEIILVAKLCAGTEERVSPRVAAQAASCAIELGPEFLDTIEGIDTSMISEMISQVELQTIYIDDVKLLEKIKDQAVKTIDELRLNSKSLEEYVAIGEVLKGVKEKLSSKSFNDDTIELYSEVNSLIEYAISVINQSNLTFCNIKDINENINNWF